jgi:zinc protease
MKELPAVLSPFGPCRPDFQHYSLENGLQVVLCPDYFKPAVAVCIAYHAGSAMEEPGKTGITHLIEHLLCNKTEYFPYPEMDVAVLEMGAKMSAYTTRDLVWTEITAPRDTLEKIVRMESDRMGYFIHTITQEDINKERKVIIQEILNAEKHLTNNPWILAQPLLFDKPHPYHHGTLGEYDDVFNWQLEDVRQYHQQYFVPNNAVITITGDFDPDLAKQLVEKYFGDIPPGRALNDPVQFPVNLAGIKSFVWPTQNCNKPLLAIYFPMPSLTDEELVVMELTSRYFLRYRETSLNSLLKNKGLASSMAFGIDKFERSSYLKLLIWVKRGVNMNEVIACWDEYLNSFPQEGIDISGMADTINEYLDFHQPNLREIGKLCTQMCHDTILRDRPDAIFDDFEAVDKLICDDLMSMFHKLYQQQPYMTFGILPPDELNLAIENAVVFQSPFISEVAEKARPKIKKQIPPLPVPFSLFDRSIEPPYLPNTPEIEHPEVWTKEFDNGMKMMGIKSGMEHEISLRLILKGGVLFEPPGKTGLTYLVTEVWKKCRRADGKSKIVSEFLNFNAEFELKSRTTHTQIDIHFEKKHFASIVSLIEALLLESKYDNKTFDEVKDSTLRMIDRLKSSQYEQSDILASKVLCGFTSPHAIPTYSTNGNQPDCISTITSDEISQYFNQHFTPHLAHFLIYGNIKPEECIGHFTSIADKWQGKPLTIPPPVIVTEKPDMYEQRVAGSAQSYLQLVLPIAKDKHQQEIELQVAFHPLIMQGFRNLITAELRVKHAFTYNNYSFICPLYDARYFSSTFFIDHENEQSAIKIVDDLLAAYPATYTEALFEKSRQRILRERLIYFNKPKAYTNLLTDIALYDYPPDHFEREDAIIRAMTYEKAKEIVNRNFGERRYSWTIV